MSSALTIIIIIIYTVRSGCKVWVPGQHRAGRCYFCDGYGHLSRLEVQQRSLVDDLAQARRQGRGHTCNLKLCAPYIRCHFHKPVCLFMKMYKNCKVKQMFLKFANDLTFVIF